MVLGIPVNEEKEHFEASPSPGGTPLSGDAGLLVGSGTAQTQWEAVGAQQRSAHNSVKSAQADLVAANRALEGMDLNKFMNTLASVAGRMNDLERLIRQVLANQTQMNATLGATHQLIVSQSQTIQEVILPSGKGSGGFMGKLNFGLLVTILVLSVAIILLMTKR